MPLHDLSFPIGLACDCFLRSRIITPHQWRLNYQSPAVANQSGWKAYRGGTYDTLKIYVQAHGSKTSNLIINLDHDDWILDDDSAVLSSLGFENETEVSFFNRELYEAFKTNPETKWD